MLWACRSARSFVILRNISQSEVDICRRLCVLGIETSCDDTGIAAVELAKSAVSGGVRGQVLANVLSSQQITHTRYGGIIPPRAQDLHRSRIEDVFHRCIETANIKPEQLDAIAITTKPGLPMSLLVGIRFARYLARKYKKPLVPVHHMEAHALQARMEHEIAYPFLCLLISGGHCQLAMVNNPGDIVLLGETLDDAPGEIFDKIARRLRLYLHPKYRTWNGGRAVEDAARVSQNMNAFDFPLPLSRQRNCNFSFAGIKNNAYRAIKAIEKRQGTPPDRIIDKYNDFCASLLNASCRHLMHRTQRAIEFCIGQGMFGVAGRSIVVSGGVANNDYIFANITRLGQQYNCATFRPAKKYCSDNGVMIAWNGIERILMNTRCMRWDYDNIDIVGKASLGRSLIEAVEQASIKCKWIQPSPISS